MVAGEGLPLLQDPASPRTRAKVVNDIRKQHMRRRAAVCVVLVVILVTVGFASSRHSLSQPTPSQLLTPGSAPYAKVMAAHRETTDFDGVVQVQINGDVVFADWSGKADEESDVAMSQHSIFPVGSNSKLITSVSLYQLQERGLVNLSDPVTNYLTQDDFANFGFPNQTTWCPRVAGAAPDSPCENITFVQLMHMGSGIGDSLNCDNVDAAHCYGTADNLLYYKGSLGPYVGMVINDPLVFKPDTNYSYSNANYYVLSYMVEKISGELFENYAQKMIFDKIGLTETSYDPYAGALGIHKGRVREYTHYYAQPSTGSPDKKAELIATGTCAPTMNDGAISGSGGFWSSVPDMQRWYLDLFDNRGKTSKVLSEASIRMILERTNPVVPSYGQGIGVGPRRTDKWPTLLSYCGGVKCTTTCMMMLFPENSTDSSVVASSFSNHVHFGFEDRQAFECFHPTNFMTDADSTKKTDDMSTNTGGAMELLAPIVQAYRNKN